MAQVPEKVLNWLYGILHEYHDSKRTYADTVRALSNTPSLSPRTEVYTFENGSPALLLTISGTLPVTFRGTTYRFPVKLWVPHAYPREAPMVYVTPGRDMMVRPGQHVGVDGRVYHPYLRDWPRMWDRASIAELLEFLQQVFTKEPPVISKAQQQQYQRPIGQGPPHVGAGSSVPPVLPPKPRTESMEPQRASDSDAPPPRPPKPGADNGNDFPLRISSRDLARDGPPLPPLPGQAAPSPQHGASQYRNSAYGAPVESRTLSLSLQNPRYPPQPGPTIQANAPQDWQQRVSIPSTANFERSPVSPISPENGYSELPAKFVPQGHEHPRQFIPQPQNNQSPFPQQHPVPGLQQRYPQPRPAQQQQQQTLPPQQRPFPIPRPAQVQQYPKPSLPDLLSDPFDMDLPTLGPPQPAPPIPPNPEKEHLLRALSTTLTTEAHARITQTTTIIAPLQAQNAALRSAHERLQSELANLEKLDQAIASNESILRHSLAECDSAIAAATTKPLPPVDDVLVAPTMVATQLWTLCAEEAACREAMYVLQKAVDRGRVSGVDFARQMRSLGRECFLKMMLARKCARGLGLEVAP